MPKLEYIKIYKNYSSDILEYFYNYKKNITKNWYSVERKGKYCVSDKSWFILSWDFLEDTDTLHIKQKNEQHEPHRKNVRGWSQVLWECKNILLHMFHPLSSSWIVYKFGAYSYLVTIEKEDGIVATVL